MKLFKVYKRGMRRRKISQIRVFGIPPNTFGTILKIKDLIVASYENFTTSTSHKRNRSSSHVTHDNVENALLGWFKETFRLIFFK